MKTYECIICNNRWEHIEMDFPICPKCGEQGIRVDNDNGDIWPWPDDDVDN